MVFILTICPAIIAATYYLKIRKIRLWSIELPVFTIIFLFLILLCTLAVQYVRSDGIIEVFNDGYFTIQYTVKYMVTSLVFSLLLPHILYLGALLDETPGKIYKKIRKVSAKNEKN
jgi:hypothetical protein